MVTVTFEIHVQKSAVFPNVQVEAGLDVNGNRGLGPSEILQAVKQSNGRYRATFNMPSPTTGTLWLVVVRAAAGSTYMVDITDGSGTSLLTAMAQGSVLANRKGASIGELL